MTFSPETLALFDSLLDGLTLAVGAPDFEQAATQVIAARRELAEARMTDIPRQP